MNIVSFNIFSFNQVMATYVQRIIFVVLACLMGHTPLNDILQSVLALTF